MFPPSFAGDAITEHSQVGDVVLDPFSGRGTAPFEALLGGRRAIGADINPVAYCLTGAKMDVPQLGRIMSRLDQLEFSIRRSRTKYTLASLPTFFHYAFRKETLRQLLLLRRNLRWRDSKIDRFITAVVLGILHGESANRPHYLSASMPHSIATKPNYQLKYWRKHRITPPERNVIETLRNRVIFRLMHGTANAKGRTYCCDVRQLAGRVRMPTKVALVITSPPYLDVTSFEEDQWLRLWFLGGEPRPRYGVLSPDDRHRSERQYFKFLVAAWRGIAPLLSNRAKLICRIGSRRMTDEDLAIAFETTLKEVWPRARQIARSISNLRNRQAASLQPGSVGCRTELDFVYQLSI